MKETATRDERKNCDFEEEAPERKESGRWWWAVDEDECRRKSTDESSVFKIPVRLRGFALFSSREKASGVGSWWRGTELADRDCRGRPEKWRRWRW